MRRWNLCRILRLEARLSQRYPPTSNYLLSNGSKKETFAWVVRVCKQAINYHNIGLIRTNVSSKRFQFCCGLASATVRWHYTGPHIGINMENGSRICVTSKPFCTIYIGLFKWKYLINFFSSSTLRAPLFKKRPFNHMEQPRLKSLHIVPDCQPPDLKPRGRSSR